MLRFMVPLLIASVVAVAAAAAGEATTKKPTFTPVPASQKVDLTMVSYMPLVNKTELNTLISGFEAAHPNIKVTVQTPATANSCRDQHRGTAGRGGRSDARRRAGGPRFDPVLTRAAASAPRTWRRLPAPTASPRSGAASTRTRTPCASSAASTASSTPFRGRSRRRCSSTTPTSSRRPGSTRARGRRTGPRC